MCNWRPNPYLPEPFGEVEETVAAIENNIRFPGQYEDGENGLHYNYFRDYDPSLRRYVESDPIGADAGPNTYSYVGNNPLIFVDPNGLIQWDGSITVGALAVGKRFRLGRFNLPARIQLLQGVQLTLTSECIDGKQLSGFMDASNVSSSGLHVPTVLFGANVSFDDGQTTLAVSNLLGAVSVDVKAFGGGPLNYSIANNRINGSSIGIGLLGGSISFTGFISSTQNMKEISCGC